MIHPQIGVHIDLAKEIVRLDKADRLRAIFQPFQDNGPELRRMVPDLENRAREAVAWWHSYDHLHPVAKLRAAYPPLKLDKALTMHFAQRLEKRIQPHEQHVLRRSIWDEVRPRSGRVHHQAFGPFLTSIFIPSALALIGETEEAKRFEPLIALWRDGNFPIGFDRQKLVILVAP